MPKGLQANHKWSSNQDWAGLLSIFIILGVMETGTRIDHWLYSLCSSTRCTQEIQVNSVSTMTVPVVGMTVLIGWLSENLFIYLLNLSRTQPQSSFARCVSLSFGGHVRN